MTTNKDLLNLVLEAETATCMRLLGVKRISELGPKFVRVSSSLFLARKGQVPTAELHP